jgi:hypothetical protein
MFALIETYCAGGLDDDEFRIHASDIYKLFNEQAGNAEVAGAVEEMLVLAQEKRGPFIRKESSENLVGGDQS